MIPLALPLAQNQELRCEILAAVADVLDSGNYVLGSSVAKFEQDFAEFCGAPFGIGVNSGTDALTLGLRSLGIGAGDEVVTVSHTALATVAAILATGATPVCVDIDSESYTLSPKQLASAISTRTKVVVVVHLYGNSADMDAIMPIARAHGCFVVEDCAQAAGGRYKGQRLGGIGDVGCFSFYPTKNLGAVGDGGMVITRDPVVADRLRRLRQYGWDAERTTAYPGYNSRLDELQAAILSLKLRDLDRVNARRIEIAHRYSAALEGYPIVLPSERSNAEHVYHLFVIRSKRREALRDFLRVKGIATGVHYPIPAHRHGGYDRLISVANTKLVCTDEIVGEILSLPMFPELSNKDVDHVISAIQSFFG